MLKINKTLIPKSILRMKKIGATLIILFTFNFFSFAQLALPPAPMHNLEWHSSLQEVHELSKATHKPIFAFFTGSDWCGWCKKLQRDVFAKPEFVEWASKNVILLELDFPRTKQLPPDLAQQNSGMQQALKVTGYPTCWILFTAKDEATNNFNLAPVGSLGYPQGAEIGNEQIKFLNDANKIMSTIKQN